MTTQEAARAQLRVAEAQARNSAAVIKQREAQLGQARVDLGRTQIRAPVDGIVIKRSVEPGQTVAASLQAPEMFVIAQNLTDMRVETAIDEADVGRLQLGQEATFTVDAFPGKRFKGDRQAGAQGRAGGVERRHLHGGRLGGQPGPDPAAGHDRQRAHRHGAEGQGAEGGQRRAALSPAEHPATTKSRRRRDGNRVARKAKGQQASVGAGKLWVLDADGKPAAIEVKTGISDGSQTELLEGELVEGREVIVGTVAVSKPKVASPRMF